MFSCLSVVWDTEVVFICLLCLLILACTTILQFAVFYNFLLTQIIATKAQLKIEFEAVNIKT